MNADGALLTETPAQRRKRRVKKIFVNLLFALTAYGAVVVGARLLHRRALYQPPSASDDPKELPAGATLLTATAADGVPVHALVFAGTKAKRTIVHFHGNAENADDNAGLARELAKKGFDVVLTEYRGYGRSRSASPTEDGLYLDAVAVLDALAVKGVTSDAIVLFGQSLGTGIATEMALRGRGARLILVAPYTSTVDLAARAMPILPSSLVMVDRFDTLSKAPRIEMPTLVVHGDIDDVIPFEQGERVSKAFPHAHLTKVVEGRHDRIYKSATVISDIVVHASEGSRSP